MRFRYFYIILSWIIIFIFNSCQREIDWSVSLALPDPNNGLLKAPVNASVTGLVVDENNNPMSGVIIKASNAYTSSTDSKGHFNFDRIILDRYTSIVTAEASGYFKGYRIFSSSQQGLNFIKIQLLKKIISGIINSSTGGYVSTPDYTITLPPAGVINKNTGAVYNGPVTVYSSYIDPFAQNISAIVPGALIGIDSLSKRVRLQSLGMLAVEMVGASGETLQIASGITASIKIEIPSLLVANAPSEIPLWYLDEQTGIWKQEGIAIKNGTTYSGSVKHFSFWNADIAAANMVFLEMTIKDIGGHPLPHTLVEIKADSMGTNWSYPSFGYTDAAGYVSGLVPAGLALTLSVKNECYSTACTKQINPLSQNTNLGTINVNVNAYEITINGSVKNCSGQPVTNGWVDVFLDNKSYKANISGNGIFNISVLHCLNNLTLIANDIAGGKSGNPVQFIIGVDSVSNLTLTACDVPLVVYMVSTLAGSDTGYVDGTGATAKFYFPEHVVVDAAGNVIVSDVVNNRIRKVTTSGIVTTIAGDGTQGFADGIGTSTKFYYPGGLAIDASGNIIVADVGNSRIRKISPSGVVTTIAGNGTFGYADGVGTSAVFSGPEDVAIDISGNIYVADYNNHRIRKISPAAVVTTIAGDGIPGYVDGPAATARFNYPMGVAIDTAGNIIVTDFSNYRVRKISTTGIVSTIAGNGTTPHADGIGTAAGFSSTDGVRTDNNGNIYVAEYSANCIRKISPTSVVTTIAGSPTSGSADGIGSVAQFFGPKGIATTPSGIIYVADRNNCRIRKLTPQ